MDDFSAWVVIRDIVYSTAEFNLPLRLLKFPRSLFDNVFECFEIKYLKWILETSFLFWTDLEVFK